MTRTKNGSATVLARSVLLGTSAFALYLCARAMLAIAKRVTFATDLVPWPDDYVLNELVKLRLGAPLYGSYDDASSFIYTPGGVLLHHALLAPFGLDIDIVANRVLAQAWLVLAAVLGVRLVGSISEGGSTRRAESIVGALGAGAALLLAGYSSSIVDSLHPGTLELLMLTVAATFAAQWPRLSFGSRIAVALLMPACATLAKQTGASVAFALAGIALLTKLGSLRQRLTLAAVSLASPALVVLALQLATHGAFARWGLLLPLLQPRLMRNALSLGAVFTAVAPALVLMTVRAQRAFERRDTDAHAAFLRVATVPLAYMPSALLPFLKVGGGAYDFCAIMFFCVLLALAEVRSALTRQEAAFGPLLVAPIVMAQLVMFSPQRPVPTEVDKAWSKKVCSHVAEALACGERVWVEHGVSCLIDGGITTAPRDRGFTILELTWAGLHQAAGTARRLAAEEYDLLLLRALPPPGPWSAEILAAMNEHYTTYLSISPPALALPTDRDLHDGIRIGPWFDWPMKLLERKRDAGHHRREIVGPPRCRETRE